MLLSRDFSKEKGLPICMQTHYKRLGIRCYSVPCSPPPPLRNSLLKRQFGDSKQIYCKLFNACILQVIPLFGSNTVIQTGPFCSLGDSWQCLKNFLFSQIGWQCWLGAADSQSLGDRDAAHPAFGARDGPHNREVAPNVSTTDCQSWENLL